MKTLDIEIAVMKSIGVRQNVIVPNTSFGLCLGRKTMHECDILSLSKSGYATEIEIKVSKADLLKDKQKKHGHNHNHIKYLYFAVPEILESVALDEIPERAGLFVCRKRNSRVFMIKVKAATANKNGVKWSDKERMKLMRLGCMRILGLKQKISRFS